MDEKHRTAMQQALEALKAGDRYIDMLEFEMSCEQPRTFYYKGPHRDREKVQAAIAYLEAMIAALAEQEQGRKRRKPKNSTTPLGIVCFEAYARSEVGSNRWDIAAEAVRAALAEPEQRKPLSPNLGGRCHD